METESAVTHAPATDTVELKFTGQAGEYFRIWIVNICLSIVTLGIYSAWAKVRRKRYFYGCTLLNDSAFEYLGDPKVILKGRVIVFVVFVAYALLKEIHPLVAVALTLAFLALLPWVLVRALQFNARNSAHRNVRFGFSCSIGGMAGFLLLPILAVPLSLGLAYPYYLYAKRKFFLEHSAYGSTPFSFSASVGAYYLCALKVLLAFVGFLIGSVITFGIGALPLYILVRTYSEAAFSRIEWRNTALADVRFDCAWTAGGLFKLYLVNGLGILFSVGLLAPWAAVRTARYKLGGIALHPAGRLGGFLAAAQDQVSAVGDETGELLGFDFGL